MNNEKLGQEPAFATSALLSGNEDVYQSGMSKRFYAACEAMKSIISREACCFNNNIGLPDIKTTITEAYAYADELLKQESL